MTDTEKTKVIQFRQEGRGNKEIAKLLGLSLNTVKSFLRRNPEAILTAPKEKCDIENKNTCKQCGKNIELSSKTKPKKFCCDRCRYQWWNAHRELMQKRTSLSKVCAGCGKTIDCGVKARKYCSHGCYVGHRFGVTIQHDPGTV